MEYPKINSLWKRQNWYFDQDKKKSPDYQKGRQSFIVGDYAEPEFGSIKHWRVDEKIDGTNVRIFYDQGKVTFGGRTKEAQLPVNLFAYLQANFGDWNLCKVFPTQENEAYPNVILFGEGYGPKIQLAGNSYRDDVGFILFDVWVGGWWLKRENVKEIANQLNIPMVPDLGIMTEEEIIEFVKSKPLSRCSEYPQTMEGVVCRSEPLMLFRNGKPLMWKLKTKEF
jgi:ATP-dependent RNA circularization protein (DNA/RNA ligase family)